MTVDILILSNGPGELATWVRPAVQALRQQLANKGTEARISVVLSPCPHATGKEAEIALSYPEVDRVQAPEHFFRFLLSGKTAQNWDWYETGVVLFLGGDQFFTVVIGKRLKYRTVTYAEWDARWYRWIDRFAAMKPEVLAKVPQKYADKFTVVGDLIAEVGDRKSETKDGVQPRREIELIGLLPGSKAAKLALGVPLCLAIAQSIHRVRPETRFVIPVAPSLDVQTLARFADAEQNPCLHLFANASAELHLTESPFLQTATGLKIELWTQTPAYDLLSKCSLCLTTVGANTAELGSLAVPMIVLIPTQQLDAMKAWDGLPGLLANLPLVGSVFATGINWLILQLGRGKLYAWPNIWAGEEIVPELIGRLEADVVADLAIDYLSHPDKLARIGDRLRSVRGESGAARKIAELVCEEVDFCDR
ncbi:MAG: lipid-A-disaccharide synthase [Microcoleus sp. PH2017_01_SCD_O_A]|uniref:lipid-A-disaccharide synthase n=1 Tax=Microcoleus sp. PH2017_01_SCD_O_A TaxID=2798812 RepID=UPI001DF536A4|nr:lipid-A-disaccharide synthase [Microcoleus sp. PH2017_01_SCD_O_A]MCC3421042.1 lipid-A-disaccharide synthase [Microcoleus sp. PH2017_07_MST_O_A]MCC3433692.1 lipid-A-disaccharide synthase [Microcoleus sp. PH2017_04_SCI_O_A]MCC3513400.1 lipid-A-disaccharide synthase [Microcoleus sp. PH2017_17_BER_D_A]TAG66518.1 MAG: lipid-A-disaccharide synthase [Oscillatoriales cyanobacterium]MCC3425698.1 lipid-A-disaccharide synthase [Microcoleus sp. PH2017_01_SCD_O_A]